MAHGSFKCADALVSHLRPSLYVFEHRISVFDFTTGQVDVRVFAARMMGVLLGGHTPRSCEQLTRFMVYAGPARMGR